MKEKNFSKHCLSYLRMDFIRAFTSWELYIGIAGICFTLFLGILSIGLENSSVIYLIWYSTFSIQFLLTMVFGAIPYSGAICEDLEYGYIQQILMRGTLKSYCVCKTIMVLFSSIFAFVIGMLVFSCSLRFSIPWVNVSDSVYKSAISSGAFRAVLSQNYFCLYIILFAVQLGMMIGILSLASVFVSLFVSNKLLVLSIPVIAYYFISQYLAKLFPNSGYFNLNTIFGGTSNLFDNDIVSFLYSFTFMSILAVILTCFIYIKLKRRLYGA